jgi:hypothetical protein
MRHRLAASCLAGLVLAGGGATGSTAMTKEQRPLRSTDQPRPRHGDVAIREELEAARRANTRAAYDLFIARHDGHPMAATARRERDALAAR